VTIDSSTIQPTWLLNNYQPITNYGADTNPRSDMPNNHATKESLFKKHNDEKCPIENNNIIITSQYFLCVELMTKIILKHKRKTKINVTISG